MNQTVLAVRNLVLKAKSKIILNAVGFDVAREEAFAVVGHNGAGKTSLFQTVLGLRFAQAGSISIDGVSYLAASSRKSVGYVPERPYFSMEYSLRETLQLLGSLSGMTKAEIEKRQAPLLESLNLTQAADQRLKTFSKGMLQKSLLIQAVLHDPEILILDEPMSGLDPKSRKDLRAFLLEWKKQKKTLLFSSHAVEDVLALADRVLELDQGAIKYLGSPQSWNTPFRLTLSEDERS